jgi:hypothetical protein
MIRVYSDESSNGVFLMAAWISSAEEWDRLADAWNTVLLAPPAIRYFSHHEAKSVSGEFADWSEQDRDEKILALAEVICEHKPLYGISTGLIMEKFEAEMSQSVIPKKTLRTIAHITDPYQFAFFEVVCRVLQVQVERGIEERVDFVFDEHSLLEECVDLYRELKSQHLGEKQKAIAGTVSPGNDKAIPALQAADLLAGQLTTSLRRGKHEPPLKKLRDSIEIFTVPIPLPSHMALEELFQALNVIWSTKRPANIREKHAPPG